MRQIYPTIEPMPKSNWLSLTLIIILILSTIAFAWIALKEPECLYRFEDQDKVMCVVED